MEPKKKKREREDPRFVCLNTYENSPLAWEVANLLVESNVVCFLVFIMQEDLFLIGTG